MATPDDFRASSEWLSSTPAAASLPNDTKLELYGIFKFVSASAGPSGARPSIFSVAARAKYDAWAAQTARYAKLNDGAQQARGRYVGIAKEVGWKGEGLDMLKDEDDDLDLEHLSDDDEADTAPRRFKGKGRADGMGIRVSQMARPEGEAEQDGGSDYPIHDAIIDESIDEVRRLLDRDPSLINARDAYGNTPLHLAADRGHIAIALVLLEAGADRNLTDEDGQTPLQLAELTKRDDIVLLLQ
ncbi:ankyrin repeat-containing domain protein [Naematelia encephala]|uniref:Ankyrin repeat-containing domain protein n=1 Tax=Naematelia encephala TaxID=71784 RepID=A0A1Y2B363_9TREE|nr:ankyrin repeat-containing domain protein [Naematelia encephala]